MQILITRKSWLKPWPTKMQPLRNESKKGKLNLNPRIKLHIWKKFIISPFHEKTDFEISLMRCDQMMGAAFDIQIILPYSRKSGQVIYDRFHWQDVIVNDDFVCLAINDWQSGQCIPRLRNHLFWSGWCHQWLLRLNTHKLSINSHQVALCRQTSQVLFV